MRLKFKKFLRWLYPGMGVKRWAALATLAMLAFIFGLILLFGRGLVRWLYALLVPAPGYALLIGGLLLAGGVAGTALGIQRFLNSLIKGVAPEALGQAGEVIYAQRVLSRGPSVVALGGGTGLSVLLRGLKEHTSNITAVVSVMDTGGSSGRLRREMEILPPGDIRNCIIALADDESRIAALFQHRFREGSFNGHSLGNLVIAGLQERTGRFDLAIAEMSHILNIRGQVLPATLEQVDLIAEMEDGEFVRGEEEIARDARKIKKIFLSKRPVRPYEQILEEISQAEVIVLGPGSLFTSIIPNLLVEDVAQEIERASATKFYIVNLMTQPGETDGFTAGDHLRVLGEYIDISKLDYIVINSQPVPEPLLRQYEADHAVPVVNDLEPMDLDLGPEGSKPKLKPKPKVITADLLEIVELEGKPTVKHNSKRLAELIMEEVRERSQRPRAITKRRIL
ncbi:TPA: uridine diphosphate-N-acetylglucosamine-binding protein YvcK [Candidatus Bipolaricaulota bacterium]|nr:uridine diphosphate-N-acetylglucosamine-binding protein YvcK [Candidatus Bipolaricaulota bacterium]